MNGTGSVPEWVVVLEAATEWGVPPWVIDNDASDIWIERWAAYRAEKHRAERVRAGKAHPDKRRRLL